MGVGEEDAEEVDDAIDAGPQEEAEYLDQFGEQFAKEATPLQKARLRVSTLRIELTKTEEKISQGGPPAFLTILQQSKEKKDMEIATSLADLAQLQAKADEIQKTQDAKAQAANAANTAKQALAEAEQAAADAAEVAEEAAKFAQRACENGSA